jgi:cytochrome c biogenesis protein CcmG/thiol:disulfide interchange protein DsbE
MPRALYALPLLTLAVVLGFAVRGLSIDTRVQPSALIEKPLPDLSLDPLPGYGEPFGAADLKGRVSLLNVFGSWCAYCQVEHPFLMRLASEGVPIYGLDWREDPAAGAAWLDRHGNPYVAVGADQFSDDALNLGVTGAPETFIVDAQGLVRHRHVGPVTEEVWRKELAPRIEALELAAASPSA